MPDEITSIVIEKSEKVDEKDTELECKLKTGSMNTVQKFELDIEKKIWQRTKWWSRRRRQWSGELGERLAVKVRRDLFFVNCPDRHAFFVCNGFFIKWMRRDRDFVLTVTAVWR